jgi:hypothetical protein
LSKQAQWVVKGFVTAFAEGVDVVFWHSLYDSARRSYGLLTSRGKPKPSYYTYKLMTEKLKGFVAVQTIS